MHSCVVLFIILLISQASLQAHHKIIYLISPPRSLSVAFTRMMQARGDFEIFNEASQRAYVEIARPFHAHWFHNDALKTFSEVKEKICSTSHSKNVFVKEISWAVKDFILNDSAIMQDPDIFFVFLLRKPHDAIISGYKRCINPPNLKDIIGYESCYELYSALASKSSRIPLILLTEDLYNNPLATVQKFCEYCDISFMPESLHWNDLGQDFNGIQEWHESKFPESMHHWHGDAIHSTCFHKPCSYALNENGEPTFEEISPEHFNEYIKAYAHNKLFYDLLIAEVV